MAAHTTKRKRADDPRDDPQSHRRRTETPDDHKSRAVGQSFERRWEVYVSAHAVGRYRQRVSDDVDFPRSQITQEFLQADDVELNDPRITDPVRVHPSSGVAYVYDPDDWTIMTCFIPTPEQLDENRGESQ